MWDMQQSCVTNSAEQLQANYRQGTQDDLVRAIPAIYYKDVSATHIVDKCRSWTLPDNMAMLKRYVRDDPKVIVLTRPVDEIAESFIKLRDRNNWQGDLSAGLLDPGSEPIMRSLAGVHWAQANNHGEFLFIEYADLIKSTNKVVDSIYKFCEIEPYTHDFTNVINNHPEDDSVYGLIGQHDIRSKIGTR